MSIVYQCRHCGHQIGSLDQHIISTSALGWNTLNAQDMKRMIEYRENGDVCLKVICESCESALHEHPNYYELDYFLQ